MEQKNNIIDFYSILKMNIQNLLGADIDFEFLIIPEVLPFLSGADYKSSIEINGVLNGDLHIFSSKQALKIIINQVFPLDYSELEKNGMLQDCLNEFLNIIIANSTEQLSEAQLAIEIGVPEQKEFGISKHFNENSRNVLKIKTTDDAFYLALVNK